MIPEKKTPPKKGGKKKKGPAKKKKGKASDGESKPKVKTNEVKWTEEDLKKAIALVKSGESAWKISKQFGIRYNAIAAATKASLYGTMYSKLKPGKAENDEKEKDEKSKESKTGVGQTENNKAEDNMEKKGNP